MPYSGISISDHMLLKRIFLKTEFRSVTLLTSLQLMNGNRRQNDQKVFKGYPGMTISFYYRDQPWFSVFKHSMDHEECV